MAPDNPARIFAVGVNHRSGSVFLRDRLFVDEEMLPEIYGRLARHAVQQAVVLSTCDRVEVQGADREPARAAAAVRTIFESLSGANVELGDAVYERYDEAAVRHIFAVASSLDSQIVGEPQVLGQVKEAHRHAGAAGMLGPELDNVLQSAYTTAKRVRTETSIGERAVSIAAAATQIATDIHGELDECGVLVVGLGEIGDLILRQLRAAGAARITLTGPGRRTEREAMALGLHHLPFEDLADGLSKADIVISAAGLGRILVDQEMVAAALRVRRRRPILLLDGGMPADIEADVHDLDGAFVYSLDDLEQIAHRGRQQREAVAAEAGRIVDEEVDRWLAGRNVRDLVPTVVALRAQYEAARRDILTSRPGIDAEEATRLLVNRLLHGPTRTLRDLAAAGDDSEAAEDLVRRLFALDDEDTTENGS